jgi:hypothetical protein
MLRFLSHRDDGQPLVEVDGIEPTTPCLQSRCSPTELHPQEILKMKVFWFFSLEKNCWKAFFLKKEAKTFIHQASHNNHPLVGQGGFEPPTPRLSSVCSNQLSYWPKGSHENRIFAGAPIPERISQPPTKRQKIAPVHSDRRGEGIC